MNDGGDLGTIRPGMSVYGRDGELIGSIEAVEAAGIRVLNYTVPPTAIERIERDGVHLRLARAAFQTAPSGAADTAYIGEDTATRLVLPLVEERLTVGTRQIQLGEAQVVKRVIEEQVMVPVTVRREEVEIIRRAPGEPREEIDDPSVVEVIRIPLRGEEPVISTQAVVTSEVVINRAVRTEEQQVTRTVRSTDITVEERLHEAYTQAQPAFEQHFTARQRQQGVSGTTADQGRAFRDAEPNYRAGFLAGSDGRYAGRTFEEIEPELPSPDEPAERDPGMLEQIREEVREGFARARASGAH